MKKLICVLLATFTLTACVKNNKNDTKYIVSCVEGVSYIRFSRGVTVQYEHDGSIKTCD